MGAPNKYGNEATILGARAQDTKLLLDSWHAPGVDEYKRSNEPGAWALSLRVTNRVGTGGGTEVNSALAQVTFGSGGAAMVVRVNVFPDAMIVLPSATCRVELMWDPFLPAGSGYTLPTSVTVQGIMQRVDTAQSNARRVRWLPRIITLGSPELANIEIPPFARAVKPYGDHLTSPAFSSDLLWSFLPIGTVRSGMNLGSLAARGTEYEIESGISGVSGNLNTPNFGGTPFTVPGTWGLDWRIEL